MKFIWKLLLSLNKNSLLEKILSVLLKIMQSILMKIGSSSNLFVKLKKKYLSYIKLKDNSSSRSIKISSILNESKILFILFFLSLI
jgi:hypothetical protein